MKEKLPVAIIGAGPVGLAAAAHLSRRKQAFVVLERGARAGHAVRQWSHVRAFTTWAVNIDEQARVLLQEHGWDAPDKDSLPTGGDLVDRYLQPLADHPAIAPSLRYDAQVLAVGRMNMDKAIASDREGQPFEIRLANGEKIRSRAVIDASGTWFSPNPLGSSGYPAIGETENAGHIRYRIPDVLHRDRRRYAGKRVLVVGSGHSAMNVLLDLARLRKSAPGTEVQWAIRRGDPERTLGSHSAGDLPARGALAVRVREVVESGDAEVLAPFKIFKVEKERDALLVTGEMSEKVYSTMADEIIVSAGFRPDLAPLREIHLRLDPKLESAEAIAPLIDPVEHSCATVPPHGHGSLSHPEKDFYIAGMKSYGRAPTFLMITGYEQVRSIVAALCGDFDAANSVEFGLVESGDGPTCKGSSACGGGEEHTVCCGPSPKV